MQVKEIEGEEYILKSDVDTLVSQRIAKVSERARTAETKLADLKDSGSKLEAMAGQVEQLRTELSESRSRYDRHSTISSAGFTDPDLRDAIEWAYSRESSKIPKKDRPSLGDWISEMKTDPSKAPLSIRPHLMPQKQEQTDTRHQHDPLKKQALPTASGAMQTPPTQTGADLISSGLKDGDFYRKNREAIREAWYRQKGKTPPFRF